MSWIAKWAGFEPTTKDTRSEMEKSMDFYKPLDNAYLTQVVKSMMYNGHALNLNNDSTSYVKDGYGGNISIYSIINYIITTAANVKPRLQVRMGNEWEDDPDSEILRLLRRPNPLSSYSMFVEENLGWKLLDGNNYIYAPRIDVGMDKGKTLELWTMPSTGMEVVGGGIREIIKGFKYNEWEDVIPAEDVLYLRYFNPVGAVENLSGSLAGMSPLRAAALAAKKSNSAAVAGVSAYENNGAMGIVSKDGGQWAQFNKEQAEGLSEQLKRSNGGANNFNKMAVMSGQINFQRTNMSPADLRLGESEMQSFRQIASAYKFPTQLLNDSAGATFSNQQEAQKSVYTNTIIPEMSALFEGIANWIGDAYYPNKEIRIVPDTSNIDVLQEDKAAKAAWVVNADFMTQNEKREEMGFAVDETDPKMDDYLIPTGKMFASDLDLTNDILPRGGEELP